MLRRRLLLLSVAVAAVELWWAFLLLKAVWDPSSRAAFDAAVFAPVAVLFLFLYWAVRRMLTKRFTEGGAIDARTDSPWALPPRSSPPMPYQLALLAVSGALVVVLGVGNPWLTAAALALTVGTFALWLRAANSNSDS